MDKLDKPQKEEQFENSEDYYEANFINDPRQNGVDQYQAAGKTYKFMFKTLMYLILAFIVVYFIIRFIR